MGVARKDIPIEIAEAGAPFLGVSASAKGFAWRERLAPDAEPCAIAISQRHGLPELLGRVLAARGVTLQEVATVLNPTLKALMPDPSTLRDMDVAAKRLADAIEKGEAVAVFGDYDVDGAASSALLGRFFARHGRNARIYIPDRIFEGYGPNAAAIESLVQEGARLIVTVDCGTTSTEPLARANELGADVIVIDHHQADEELPAVSALVNPNRQDDVSGLGHLCAAGVTFLVLVATTRELRQRGYYAKGTAEPDLMSELDLAARKAMPSRRPPSADSKAQRTCASPTTLANLMRVAGKAKRGDGLPCPNGPTRSMRSKNASVTPPGVRAPSMSRPTRSRASPTFSASRASKNSPIAVTLSRATVSPAAIACPPPLTRCPCATAARTAAPMSAPATERSEPVPQPFSSSHAMTQEGR